MQWKKLADNADDKIMEELQSTYYQSEEKLYKRILSETENIVGGIYEDIAKEYGFIQ